MKKTILVVLGVFIGSLAMQAQDGALGKVFMLGEKEKAYEQLAQGYSQSLLEATGNDIEKAFEEWLNMMQEMDKYAEKINYDIKGVRVWMHVFWSPEGKIDHIGYLLRADSRNVDTAEFDAFLTSFINRYTFPVQSSKPFNHYTGATFPTFSEKADN